MPAFSEANVRHLLRRTEVVDRPDRVDALMGTGSISAAVADVMSVRADPPSASFAGVADSNWRSGIRISEHWLDQMATITRPFGERMAFFWHGHICSELGKINSAVEMQQQIDLFRRSGVNGNISALVKEAAIQVAMLKYLDNDRNYKDSPNQNFARELMELFLLGVGNYTEADVEAATAAWTGHGRPRWDVNEYRYEPEQHDTTPQTFLGQRINEGTGEGAANETIDVILGTGGKRTGTVPAGAEINRNMDTNIVAADFLSKKLWQEFGEAASGGVPSGVAAAMRSALIDSGFDIRPWVTAMLNHDDFYAESTKTGLVRQPVEYSVALLVATGLSASDGAPLYLLDRAGQQPLYPPNVSGWKPNGYWVNASAMGARQELANSMLWRTRDDNWDGDDGYIDFGQKNVRFTKTEIQGRWSDSGYTEPLPREVFVDRLIGALQLDVSSATRDRVLAHVKWLDDRSADDVGPWQRTDALFLLLSAPEMHIA